MKTNGTVTIIGEVAEDFTDFGEDNNCIKDKELDTNITVVGIPIGTTVGSCELNDRFVKLGQVASEFCMITRR